MLMAGLDGIENRIDPGEPLDKDIYGLSPAELSKVPSVPGSLRGRAQRPRAITNSSPRGTCSRKTSSRRGSSTNAAGKLTRCVCGHIRMSSSCTLIFKPAWLVSVTGGIQGCRPLHSMAVFVPSAAILLELVFPAAGHYPYSMIPAGRCYLTTPCCPRL